MLTQAYLSLHIRCLIGESVIETIMMLLVPVPVLMIINEVSAYIQRRIGLASEEFFSSRKPFRPEYEMKLAAVKQDNGICLKVCVCVLKHGQQLFEYFAFVLILCMCVGCSKL